jgi:hypothetical protein
MARVSPYSRRFVVAIAGLALSSGLLLAAWQGPGPGQGPAQGPQGPGAGPRGGGGGGRGGGQAPGGPQGRGQGRGTQAMAIGTGSIAGIVTLQGAATPVRRAQVTLTGTELRGQRSTTTNEQGKFSFVGLPAGRFNLNVTKPGYVTISYGAKRPGRQGTPIQLADGQTIDNANINLPKGSVITGVVVDENGEPSPNTTVRTFRYVLQNGQKTLQQAGQNQTDDRGIYRVFQLQPGDYMVSAVPRNQGLFDMRQQLQTQLEPLLQQVQAAGGAAAVLGAQAGAGSRGGGGQGLAALGTLLGGGRGQQLLDQVQQLQQQLQQQPDEQSVAYAPVYYPGTTTPASAARVTLGVGEERSGVDFQLQLVPTAKVRGSVVSSDGTVPQGAQISLQMAGQQDVPSVPGMNTTMSRIAADGTFAFQNVTPGQYTLMVRAPVRQADANAPPDAQAGGLGAGGRGGRGGFAAAGGRGGPGPITQVLWALADVSIDGRDVSDIALNLQPGMTISGRVGFDAATAQPPTDLTRVRVSLQPAGQSFEIGPPLSAQVEATGSFTVTGVAPGKYSLRGNVGAAGAATPGAAQTGPGAAVTGAGAGRGVFGGGPGQGGGWTLKSVMVDGRDTLDFPLDIAPNQTVSGAVLTFTDKAQELSGTLQDAMGRPTADYTIILFAADNRYWTPQSRRIMSSRPGTDGKFTFRNMPAGQYRLTAVTDAEPGEWYDPGFLSQMVGASMTLTIAEGEKKTQDIRLAGGL